MEDEVEGWIRGRLPDGWFHGPAEVISDSEEILVLGRLLDADISAAQFRESTRVLRTKIGHEARQRFGRRLSWGVRENDQLVLFTSLSVPVMTRLRIRERGVLDTLVASGVARSRSDALSWCVRLVGQHQKDWIEELRRALIGVEEAKVKGPSA